ncbi:response regulator transcription factor [Streptomyces antnestii]|uniref:Response regulator transcription factor n=1 Tax=Streptomyces antnestii TaxID=2494256 RepID=A0A3S3U586_9ACTN|nr:response regulator transcription factor [Streptomyces sp. San01]RVU15016.1 response regulator transcription factor [Streptomyces sp. San01]RVU15894.1 response regulator transcription factor [Streptomyces sp. San01]
MAVHVLIAEGHAVVRQGLRDFLGVDEDIVVAGVTTNGREAVRLARELSPDVVLLDLMMPVMDGIEATEQLRRELPEVRVVALTSELDGSGVMAAVRAGATGFLLESTEADELRHAVKAAAAGRTYVSSAVVARLVDQATAAMRPERLTGRESEVLLMLARGKANKEIARELRIGQQTVKTYVSHIFDKFGVHSRTQAVAHALRLGLVPAGELARGGAAADEYRWSA